MKAGSNATAESQGAMGLAACSTSKTNVEETRSLSCNVGAAEIEEHGFVSNPSASHFL